MTEHDLYIAVVSLAEEHENEELELEVYLRSLLGLLEKWRGQPSLPPSYFVQCLTEAYTTPPMPFQESWRL